VAEKIKFVHDVKAKLDNLINPLRCRPGEYSDTVDGPCVACGIG
jgi:hypothetical protein